jgi:pyridoxamine 5'-phosphate oxidase
VRAVGRVETVADELADRYWDGRPLEARRVAAASAQSRVVASRRELEERLEGYRRRFPAGTELPRPLRWGGFRVVPATMEFWEEAPDGLHDRFRHRRVGTGWTVERLSP